MCVRVCVCVCVCACVCVRAHVCVLHVVFSVRGMRIHIFLYLKSFSCVERHMVCIHVCVCVCVCVHVCVCACGV